MKREIEIKCLLDGKQSKEALLQDLKINYPKSKHVSNRTVISYFYNQLKNKNYIVEAAKTFIDENKLNELQNLVNNSDNIVVKCRSVDDINYFAVKGAAKGEDAVHAVNRLEFEVIVDKPLEDINKALIDAGVELASKWSADRETYFVDSNVNMDIEFVSGYGYKAELEIVIDDGDNIEQAQEKIRDIAKKLGLIESSQAQFGRMYEYYNNHWEEYFNTDKVFPEEVWQKLGR